MLGKNLKVLHFRLKDIQVCMDLHYIEKVLPLPLLEIIPSSPIYFVGLMNFKNKCIPVLDLSICIGLVRDQTYSLNTPILLCSDGAHQIGLIVDNVVGLGVIDEEKIEIHEEMTNKSSPFFGAVTQNTGVVLLINISWVFALKLTEETNQYYIDHE
ncbi:MAG: chemotaxis protein CheW [Legionella longbeachae]|nr:chemotaxis protein CheW [Legionella longbeachae]